MRFLEAGAGKNQGRHAMTTDMISRSISLKEGVLDLLENNGLEKAGFERERVVNLF